MRLETERLSRFERQRKGNLVARTQSLVSLSLSVATQSAVLLLTWLDCKARWVPRRQLRLPRLLLLRTWPGSQLVQQLLSLQHTGEEVVFAVPSVLLRFFFLSIRFFLELVPPSGGLGGWVAAPPPLRGSHLMIGLNPLACLHLFCVGT